MGIVSVPPASPASLQDSTGFLKQKAEKAGAVVQERSKGTLKLSFPEASGQPLWLVCNLMLFIGFILTFILPWFSDPPRFVVLVWCLINLAKFSVITALNISSVPFSLLVLVSLLCVFYTFCGCNTALDILFCSGCFLFFFLSFFPLWFSVLEVPLDIFSSSEVLSSTVSSLLMSPPKIVLYFYYVFDP